MKAGDFIIEGRDVNPIRSLYILKIPFFAMSLDKRTFRSSKYTESKSLKGQLYTF